MPWLLFGVAAGVVRGFVTAGVGLGAVGRFVGLNRTLVWDLFPIAGLLGGLAGRIDLRFPFILGGILIVLIVVASARLVLSASKAG